MKIPTCEEKITKIKLQMNEHEMSIHVNHNSRLQIIQLEFTSKIKFRSSQQRCSIKKGVFKNFAIFTGKHLCWSLLNKVEGLHI